MGYLFVVSVERYVSASITYVRMSLFLYFLALIKKGDGLVIFFSVFLLMCSEHSMGRALLFSEGQFVWLFSVFLLFSFICSYAFAIVLKRSAHSFLDSVFPSCHLSG